MAIVTEYDWERDTFTHHEGHAARTAWREAVAEVATKAHAKLPECNGRVDSAVKMVLAGDVELLADGAAKVASQSSGTAEYLVVNGACTCKDFAKAPHHFCKHRLGAAIARRAQELVRVKLNGANNGQVAAAPDPAPAQAEAPHGTPQGIPPQHVVLIQGKPFVRFAGLLQMAHDRGLVALTAVWTFNDAELSLAHAVATFQDGRRFEESGDASPANVTRLVAVHFRRRVALTRAKARVLRDALGVDLVAVEELAEE
jgi:hypothetical protein